LIRACHLCSHFYCGFISVRYKALKIPKDLRRYLDPLHPYCGNNCRIKLRTCFDLYGLLLILVVSSAFFCETKLQMQTLTYTSAYSPLWMHACKLYPYEHH
jgi:hypothetical protein